MSDKPKVKQSKMNLNFVLINSFEGKLKYLFTDQEMDQNKLIEFMESFAAAKRISNPGDKWHAFMRRKSFTLCESKYAMQMTLEDWTEIGATIYKAGQNKNGA